MFPSRIYLSGGGMCAMAHVGALIELSTHIPLHVIKEWMGVSAGSFVAMCLCIGFTLEELADFCVRFDFTNIKEMDSVPGWLLHLGMDTGERLHKLIEACLHVKGLSSALTFKECYDKFGITLRVVATDLNDARAIMFSPEDTPTYHVANAVRASMAFPYYFQPFICPESGHYLVDGAVISNYPLFLLPKEQHRHTLSILINTAVEQKEDLIDLEIDQLITRPLNMALIEKSNIEANLYETRCIRIMLGEVNILEFSFDEDTKNKIIETGKAAAHNYFKQTPIVRHRRHSFS